MADLNQVNLIGRLTKDVELKQIPSGKAVGEFSLAINRSWKSADGQENRSTDFFDCNAWGKTAENLAKYCKKGSPIFLTGRLQQNVWEKDGQKHSRIVVVAENIQFLGNGNGEAKKQLPASPAPYPKEDVPQAETFPLETESPF